MSCFLFVFHTQPEFLLICPSSLVELTITHSTATYVTPIQLGNDFPTQTLSKTSTSSPKSVCTIFTPCPNSNPTSNMFPYVSFPPISKPLAQPSTNSPKDSTTSRHPDRLHRRHNHRMHRQLRPPPRRILHLSSKRKAV